MSFSPPVHPYPADRYVQDRGEVSARLRPASTDHDLITASGAVDYLATGATTRGDFGLYRWLMNGEPSGPAPHFHRSISESFFVISGTVRLFTGTEWIEGAPGDFLHVPAGGLHAFRNESRQPASMLILFAPGAPRERYFEGLAQIGRSGIRPSDEDLAEFYRLHDTFWVED